MKNEVVERGYSEISGMTDNSMDVIDELIVKSYKKIYGETKLPPSIRQVYKEAAYEFEIGVYDIVYGIPAEALSQDWIAIYLGVNKYIFEWGSLWYGSAQMRMFNNLFEGSEYEDEEEFEEVGLIGESEIRTNRSEL